MSRLYFDKENCNSDPFIGENLTFQEFSCSIPLTGEVQPFLGFTNEKIVKGYKQTVYVPDGSVLMKKNNFYLVKVAPDEELAKFTVGGFYKNGISFFELKEGKLEKELDFSTRKESFKFVGFFDP